MVRNKLGWGANNAEGLPKQRNSYQPSLLFYVWKIPQRYLRSSVIYSVPCDWIVQRAYFIPSLYIFSDYDEIRHPAPLLPDDVIALFLDYNVIISDDVNPWGIVTSLCLCVPRQNSLFYTTEHISILPGARRQNP